MSEDGTDPLVDLFNLLATPVAGAMRSAEQVRKGVDDFLAGVENLNQVTERINSLLAAVEGPLRTALPQFARTVQTADQLLQVVGSSAIAAAPGLGQLVDTLRNSSLTQLPDQLVQVSEALGDLSTRLGSLTTLAEAAGGLFGSQRMMNDGDHEAAPRAEQPVTKAAGDQAPAKKSPAKKAPAKKSPAKKTPAKKTPAKKAPAKKAPAKKAPAKKTAAKKAPAKKSAT